MNLPPNILRASPPSLLEPQIKVDFDQSKRVKPMPAHPVITKVDSPAIEKNQTLGKRKRKASPSPQ